MIQLAATRRALGVAIVLAAAASPAFGQDIERGKQLATAWCSGCHEVEPDRGTSDVVPSFEFIAKDPDTTKEDLRRWMFSPHPLMPNLNLSKEEVDDLVGYIKSLRGS